MILTASPLLSQSTNSGRILEQIDAYYPFFEGAPNESALFDEIESHITAIGEATHTQVERLDFREASDYHSFSEVLRVSFPGLSERRLAIAIPVSHPERSPRSRSGSVAIAAALHAAHNLARAVPEPPISLEILFLGGERSVEGNYPLGGRLFRDRLEIEPPDALIYLDSDGDWRSPARSHTRILSPEHRGLTVLSGAGGWVAPEWLAAGARDGFQGAGIDTRIDDQATQLFRIGANPLGRTHLVSDWLEAGIPSVLVVDEASRFERRIDHFDATNEPPAESNNRSIAVVQLSRAISGIPSQFGSEIPTEWDRHTLAASWGEHRLIVDEPTFLITWLSIAAVVMLYGIVFRKALARYLRTIRRNFWTIPVLFGATFVYLGASGAIVEWILAQRTVADIWQYAPLATISLKVALASALFQATYLLVGRLPLSNNPSFYTASALFITFLCILLFAVVNIAISSYFLIAFLIVFLFSISRRAAMKLLWFLCSVVPLIIPALIIVDLRAYSVIALMTADWRGDLILAAALLPSLLLFIRLGFLFSPGRRGTGVILRIFTLCLFAITGVLAAWLLLLAPFTDSRPQVVSVTDFRDFNSSRRDLLLESNAALPQLRAPQYSFQGDGRSMREEIEELPLGNPSLSFELTEQEAFLGRNRHLMSLDSETPLRNVVVEIVSQRPFLINSLNFPFTPVEDGRTQLVHIGRNPPRPLELDLVVPDGVQLEIRYRAELAAPAPELVDPGHPAVAFARAVETGRFEIPAIENGGPGIPLPIPGTNVFD